MAKGESKTEAVKAVLRDDGGPMKIGDVALAIGQSHNAVGQTLAGLAAQGVIKRVGVATYAWPTAHIGEVRRRRTTRRGSYAESILAVMRDGREMTHDQVIAATGLTRKEVTTTLSRLARKTGDVTRVSNGTYQLASAVPSRAAKVVAAAVKNGHAPAAIGNVTITLAPKQAARLIEWLMKEAL